MAELKHEDLRWCLVRLPKFVLKLLETEGPKVILGGGCVRSYITNERPSDIDLFTNTKENGELFARRLADQPDRRLIQTDNAYTILGKTPVVQVIKRWVFNKPADMIASFDFTIACAAIWYEGEKWCSLCADDYYSDIAARRLVYRSPVHEEEAGGSMLRILKFYQKGYRIPLDSLAAVIARLCLGVKDINSLSENRLAYILTGLLREVDPEIDPTHLSHLPSARKDNEDEQKTKG